ncbi:MAG: flippase-like domain-containing protein [Chloroflexi bacterium]|nr:flippase-like domain-containing protein [Chloroflexota bacterium]
MKNRWVAYALGGLLTLIIIAVLLATVDLAELLEALRAADYRLLPFMIGFGTLALATRAARWRLFLNNRLPFRDCFHISNIGYMFNNLLPLRAGEVARILLASQKQPHIPMMTSISTIFLERIVDVLFVFGMLGLALSRLPVADAVSVGGAALAAFSAGVLVLLFISVHRKQWLIGLLRRFERAIPLLQRLPIDSAVESFLDGLSSLTTSHALLWTVIWTALSWLFSTMANSALLLAFFGTPDPAAALLFSSMSALTVSASAAVAYTPAGVGPYHASVVVALAVAGITQPAGAPVAFAIVLHGANLVMYVALGLIGLSQESVTMGDTLKGMRAFIAERGQASKDRVQSDGGNQADGQDAG